MGIDERKKKEKEIRRNDIIEAAEKVFFTKGYQTATMDDVAKEAEFSKRTVYVYFNSKEQLYFKIMIRGFRLLLAMFDEEAKDLKEENALERIRKMGMILYQFSKEHSDYFSAIMEYENGELDFGNGIPDESREECYAIGEKAFGYLKEAVKDGIEDGTFRAAPDAVSTALILWSCIVGVFNTAKRKSQYIKNYHQKDPDKLVVEALDLLLRSIQKGNEK